METEKKELVFTLAEVAAHNTQTDCWVVLDNKVYDVSTFLDQHPGGGDILVGASGGDATAEFEDIGHSTAARNLRKQYLIGDIDPSTIPAKATNSNPVTKPTSTPDKSSQFILKILKFVLPLLILAIAVGSRYLAKERRTNP